MTLTMVMLLLVMLAMKMKIMRRVALTTLTWLFQVKCSPDSRGKPLKVTETFTVNTTTVQVIRMLMLMLMLMQRYSVSLLTVASKIRTGHAVSCGYAHICGCGFRHMRIYFLRIIRILIYAVYADMRIIRMSFPNRIYKRIYQQIQAFVF